MKLQHNLIVMNIYVDFVKELAKKEKKIVYGSSTNVKNIRCSWTCRFSLTTPAGGIFNTIICFLRVHSYRIYFFLFFASSFTKPKYMFITIELCCNFINQYFLYFCLRCSTYIFFSNIIQNT